MNADYYRKYEPVFNSWYLKKMLGEGSYGKVFEIEREDFGTTYKAALKTMTIPQSESEIKSVMAVEILAPAGNPESFFAAINAGANAIYIGLKEFSARKSAENF